MRVTITKIILLCSLMYSASSFAVLSYCVEGPLAEKGQDYTLYHKADYDSNDWAMGYAKIWFSGTGHPGINGEVFYIYGWDYGLGWLNDPGVGYKSIYGEAYTGTLNGGYFEAGGPTSECQTSAYFPAPTVDAYVTPSETVVQGTSVQFGFTASTSYGNGCTYLGTPVGTSGTGSPFTAQMSDDGSSHTVDCLNYFGQASDTVTLTVLECGTNYVRQIGPNTTSPSTQFTSGQLIIGGVKHFGHTLMDWQYGSLSPTGLACAVNA